MTRKELLRAITKCKKAFAWVKLTNHDMFPVQLIKADLRWEVKHCCEQQEDYWKANLDEKNNLYVG